MTFSRPEPSHPERSNTTASTAWPSFIHVAIATAATPAPSRLAWFPSSDHRPVPGTDFRTWSNTRPTGITVPPDLPAIPR